MIVGWSDYKLQFCCWGMLWQMFGALKTHSCGAQTSFFFLISKSIISWLIFNIHKSLLNLHYHTSLPSHLKEAELLNTGYLACIIFEQQILHRRRWNCWGEREAILYMDCAVGRRLWALGEVCIHHVRSVVHRFCLLLYF